MSKRKIPLPPFFSSLAILSFKKKGSGGELGGLTNSMGGMGLNGGDISLSALGEDVKSDIPSIGSRAEERRIQELESNISDLKKHAENADMGNKAIKGEIEGIKAELSQIDESIKNLLSIYEAVTRQYNPFVEGAAKPSPVERADVDPKDVNASPVEDKVEDGSIKEESPVDELGPLDKMVRPEDEEESLDIDAPAPSPPDTKRTPAPIIERAQEMADPLPPKAEPKDTFVLDQFHKLLIYQVDKIYHLKVEGREVSPRDVEDLNRWLEELKGRA